MRGSDIIPWLLLGPVMVAIAGKWISDITGWAAGEYIWKTAVVVAVIVIAIAFLANFRFAATRERKTDRTSSGKEDSREK